MDRNEALSLLLKAYSGYYNINTETPAEPFDAEAVFQLHDEQYFLIKSARISQIDSGEIVFFVTVPELTDALFEQLDARAWEEGQSRIVPKANHRNTDVLLFILADHVDPSLEKTIRKRRHYKSYKYGFHGFSRYRLIAHDLTEGTSFYNRFGDELAKVIRNIF